MRHASGACLAHIDCLHLAYDCAAVPALCDGASVSTVRMAMFYAHAVSSFTLVRAMCMLPDLISVFDGPLGFELSVQVLHLNRRCAAVTALQFSGLRCLHNPCSKDVDHEPCSLVSLCQASASH